MRLTSIIFLTLLLGAIGTLLASCKDNVAELSLIDSGTPSKTHDEVLSRKLLFQPPVQFQGRISPNGAKVSWLSKADGTLNLFVADANDPSSARQYTKGKSGVDIHEWSPNSAFILFTTHSIDKKHHKTFSLNIYSGEIVPLGPEQEQINVSLQKISRNWPNTALVAINDRDRNWSDLYRINLQTGQRKLVRLNPGFSKWVADDDLNARIGIRENSDKSADWILLLGNRQNQPLLHVAANERRGTRPLQFDPTGMVLYFLDQRGRNHSVFSALDLTDGRIHALGQTPGFSVQRVMFHPVTGTPLAWSFNADTPKWVALEQEFQDVLDLANQEIGPNFQILASTSDMRRLVLYSNRPDRPGKYSLLDRDKKTISTLFETAPTALIPAKSKTKIVKIPARDGFTLIGYLSPASGLNAQEPQSAPLVLLPQPWPGSRMIYSYDPQIQWMNSRGYSVLEINTRGAGSMGLNYDRQMTGEHLKHGPEDLIDSANWAITNGWANSDLIASIGTGFGGLNVLQALSKNDNPFECAVTLDAVINLPQTFNWLNKENATSKTTTWKLFDKFDKSSAQTLMNELSPIFQSGKIDASILMLHSNRLPAVSLPASVKYAKRAEANGTPITLAVLEGDFEAWYENKLIAPALTLSESFLAKCLGGKAEPIGDDLSGVNVQFPVGGKQFKTLFEQAQSNN